MKRLEEIIFIVLDVETTGLWPHAGDKMVEVAALKLKDGKTLGEFTSLINPRRPIQEAAYLVNRISQEDLEYAPSSPLVLSRLLEFFHEQYVDGLSCLVGYNLGFDMGFLIRELQEHGRLAHLPSFLELDLLPLARSLLPGLKSYKLSSVAECLKIKADRLHRARDDVALTAKVLDAFLGRLRKEGIMHLEDVYRFVEIER
jgi:DNA polymerase-3 subunit alpha (Gram-positive type)